MDFREREKHGCERETATGFLLYVPTTFPCTGRRSNHRRPPARASKHLVSAASAAGCFGNCAQSGRNCPALLEHTV